MPDKTRDTAHLAALYTRLSHERVRLGLAKTQQERAMRQVWVAGIEREIAAEERFLGISDDTEATRNDDDDDDALLAELFK